MELSHLEPSELLLPGLKPPFPGTPILRDPKSLRGRDNLKRVLVIDDEALIAESLSEILNRSGFDAFPFQDGQKALDAARRLCPDAVLTDVVMPKLDGVALALMIRERCPATRIVLFSGQAGTADLLREARRRGHEFEVLPKPIHPSKLLEMLRQG